MRCPACNRIIPSQFPYCSYCGEPIGVPPYSPSTSQPASAPTPSKPRDKGFPTAGKWLIGLAILVISVVFMIQFLQNSTPANETTTTDIRPSLPSSVEPVRNDIPGTDLALGASRSSVVDKTTKPRDVYALSLSAGQEVRIKVTDYPGQLNFMLAAPNSTSFDGNSYTSLFNSQGQYTYSPWSHTFVPSTSGTYYFAVSAWESSSQPYTISAVATGTVYGTGNIANDIPGTVLALGASRRSVVDKATKPRDVYALNLSAGQEVRINVTDYSGQLNFMLAAPNSTSFNGSGYTSLFNSQGQYTYSPWSLTFVPSTDTYYFAVNAWENGSQPYTISAVATGNVIR